MVVSTLAIFGIWLVRYRNRQYLGVSPPPSNATELLVDWIKDQGGEVACESRLDANGVRGLYSTRRVQSGEIILRIPAGTIIGIEKPKYFGEEILHFIHQLTQKPSDHRHYFDTLPGHKEVLNACNLPLKYIPMLENTFLEYYVNATQYMVQRLFAGFDDHLYGSSLKEASNGLPLSLRDVRYAASLVLSRHVQVGAPDPSPAMVPVFDLINHRRGCTHFLQVTADESMLDLIAGEDVEEGEEVCYEYGDMRDDYALTRYGFLPPMGSAPRLSMVDHYDFNPADMDKELSDLPFRGTATEVEGEITRLTDILNHLVRLDQNKTERDQQHVSDPIYQMFREYQKRRRFALWLEINRLQEALEEGNVIEEGREYKYSINVPDADEGELVSEDDIVFEEDYDDEYEDEEEVERKYDDEQDDQ